ncbi:aldehyde dehydrogenase [Ruegeria lacuscaerulensis]|uniref:aldehyde dehydrogenase n=1 Tax=Ruegeria lacuscaerulensis TaxID=55218 RepID=UPI00147CDAC9|nr:aldehyde dehydrogenase [Ruegeria lacuscaerulensis]
MKTYTPFISGAFLPWQGETIPSIDPASGTEWSRVARCGASEADAAIRDADLAFRKGPWASATPSERADMLDALADTLEIHWEELVEPEIRDNGKRITEVRGQFAGLHSWYRYFAAEARKLTPETQDNAIPNVTSVGHWLPYGVVVAITPWNSPLMILAWKLAPALAAGNTVVVKPSEMTSASTLEFTRLAHQSGLPPGVLNVVTGLGHEVGEALVRHPLTRKVTFTGSDFGGRKVAEAASVGVVPTTLELGGKSPQVVFADCDLENTVNGVLSGIFLSNGQTCVAGSRLIVEAPVKDALVTRLLERARGLRLGDPMDPATQVAPLANEPHLRKVTSMIAQAKADGADCLLDGTQTAQGMRGYYVGPTIFDQVRPDMQLWREEVFGPVLAIIPFDTEEEAIALANDSDYGLAAGVWTSDAAKGARVADGILSGTVYINHYRSVDPGSPIGGIKLSGYGRELGPDAIKDFLQVKSVWTGTAPVPDPFP